MKCEFPRVDLLRPVVLLDIETRSKCDLKKFGGFAYAQDPTTEILMASVVILNLDLSLKQKVFTIDLWNLERPQESEATKLENLLSQDYIFVAHNGVGFDYPVLNNWYEKRTGKRWFFTANTKKFMDTMELVHICSLPGTIDGAGKVLLQDNKMAAGVKLMQKFSIPAKATGEFAEIDSSDPIDIQDYTKYIEYCEQDVELMAEVFTEVFKLGFVYPKMMDELAAHRVINAVGFPIDLPLAKHVANQVDVAKGVIQSLTDVMTEGKITTLRSPSQMIKYALELGVDISNSGVETITMVVDMLKKVPEDVRTPEQSKLLAVCELRLVAGKSTPARWRKYVDSYSPATDSISGCFVFHKASTGRWAGRGIQPHNLTRGYASHDEVEKGIAYLRENKLTGDNYAEYLQIASDSLRSCITAPNGYKLLVADYKQIEARILGCISNCSSMVQAFLEGKDLYKDVAASIYAVDIAEVTKEQRPLGKAAALGLGYQMGAERFQAQASSESGVEIDSSFAAHIVRVYRDRFPEIPMYWATLQKKFKQAILQPGTPIKAGFVTFTQKEFPNPRGLVGQYMEVKLPSQRNIYYYGATINSGGLSYRPFGTSGTVKPANLYGGRIAENICQALARDVLADALSALHEASNDYMFPVMHVHDEVVAVAHKDYPKERFEHIIRQATPSIYPQGLLSIDAEEAARFRKL